MRHDNPIAPRQLAEGANTSDADRQESHSRSGSYWFCFILVLLVFPTRLPAQGHSVPAGTAGSQLVLAVENASSLHKDPVLKNILNSIGSQLFVPPLIASLSSANASAAFAGDNFAITGKNHKPTTHPG